jgi:hypothetical protein
VPAGQRTFGYPAMREREYLKRLLFLEKLPEMRRELLRIKEHLGLTDTDAA